MLLIATPAEMDVAKRTREVRVMASIYVGITIPENVFGSQDYSTVVKIVDTELRTEAAV